MDAVESAPAETQFAPVSIVEMLVGVLFRPYRAFERMRSADRGHWWIVALLALIGLVLTTIATVPLQVQVSQQALDEQMAAIRETDPQAAEQAEQMQRIFNSGALMGGISLVFGIAGLFIGYAIRAAILFAVGLVFGGRATFGQVWRMSVWTTLPDVIRNVIAAVVVFTTQSYNASGLSYIFADSEIASVSPLLLAVLNGIDVYWLWGMILIAAGTAATYQISRMKGLLIAVIYWLIGLAFTLGLAAIGQAFTSMAMGAG